MSTNLGAIDKAMDGKFAAVALKVMVFVLPSLMTIGGSAAAWLLNEIRSTQAEQGAQLQRVTGDVQVLNTKLDNGVIWRIGEIERRVNTIEQERHPR